MGGNKRVYYKTALRIWEKSRVLRIMIVCSLKASNSFVHFHRERMDHQFGPDDLIVSVPVAITCRNKWSFEAWLFFKNPLKVTEKRLKMMRYLRKNYYTLNHSASKV